MSDTPIRDDSVRLWLIEVPVRFVVLAKDENEARRVATENAAELTAEDVEMSWRAAVRPLTSPIDCPHQALDEEPFTPRDLSVGGRTVRDLLANGIVATVCDRRTLEMFRW